jgi:hypothetical protein
MLNSAILAEVNTWLGAMKKYVERHGRLLNTSVYIREMVGILLAPKWNGVSYLLNFPSWEIAVQQETHIFVKQFLQLISFMYPLEYQSLSKEIHLTCPPSTAALPNPFSDFICDVVEQGGKLQANPATITKALCRGLSRNWPALYHRIDNHLKATFRTDSDYDMDTVHNLSQIILNLSTSYLPSQFQTIALDTSTKKTKLASAYTSHGDQGKHGSFSSSSSKANKSSKNKKKLNKKKFKGTSNNVAPSTAPANQNSSVNVITTVPTATNPPTVAAPPQP